MRRTSIVVVPAERTAPQVKAVSTVKIARQVCVATRGRVYPRLRATTATTTQESPIATVVESAERRVRLRLSATIYTTASPTYVMSWAGSARSLRARTVRPTATKRMSTVEARSATHVSMERGVRRMRTACPTSATSTGVHACPNIVPTGHKMLTNRTWTVAGSVARRAMKTSLVLKTTTVDRRSAKVEHAPDRAALTPCSMVSRPMLTVVGLTAIRVDSAKRVQEQTTAYL